MSRRDEMAKYFVPENVTGVKEHVSPTGAYKLKVTSFTTGKGTWNYTQGLVYRKDSDEPLFEVRRNYSSFPFLWIEDHKNGHPYLVCGEDYQGQTVLELDTGNRRELLPEEAKKGHGFCWALYRFEPETSTLVVDGCYWACPYEFKLYDFSNPMEGWPHIQPEGYTDGDARWPTFESDGSIKFYQTELEDEDVDDENEVPEAERPIAAIKTFRREGLKLVLLEEWVSEKEQKLRLAREEASRKYEEWITNYKENDPLYTTMKAGVAAEPAFNPEKNISVGYTHNTWCPGSNFDEKRVSRRIHKNNNITIDIEIAADTGPVKLVIYRDGKHVEDKFFMEHSAESVRAALSYAKASIS